MLYSPVGPLLMLRYPDWALANSAFNWLILPLVFLADQVNLLNSFLQNTLVITVCVEVCVYMAQYFCNYLLDFLPLDTGTNHPQQEINTNHPTNISLQGQKSKIRSNTTLKPGKRRAQVEQVKTEKYNQMKGKVATHKTK